MPDYWNRLTTLYARKPEHSANISRFEQVMAQYEHLAPFFPNRAKAPWHLQIKLHNDAGAPVHINLWPHKFRGQVEGYKAEPLDAAIRRGEKENEKHFRPSPG